MALPKTAVQTVSFIDDYCDAYKNIFSEVRTFENFKFLHLGIMSQIQRKSLTRIAKIVGLKDSQPLNNFLKNSPWDVTALRSQRLKSLKKNLKGRSFVLVIEEIGDKKKGKTTEYVAKQYIGQLAKTENAIVSVNAYGVLDGITFPLIFKVFKPERSLEHNEQYRTKPQLAIAIIKELREMGFNFELLMIDNSYQRDPDLQRIIHKFCLELIVAKTPNRNRAASHKLSLAKIDVSVAEDKPEIRRLSPDKLKAARTKMLAEQTEIKSSISKNSGWYIKSERQESKVKEASEHNLINWVEYGFKQVKHELGWGDFRVTNYRAIEKWWEIVFSVYWMISLHSETFAKSQVVENEAQIASICSLEQEIAWHNRLTNLQSIIQFSAIL